MIDATPYIGSFPAYFSHLRLPPPTTVQHLREIDSKAELVFLAPDVWVLGDYKPWAVVKRARGFKLLRDLADVPSNVTRRCLAWLAWQGFSLIASYNEQELLSGFIVSDYRTRTFNLENRAEQEAALNLDAQRRGPQHRAAAAAREDLAESLASPDSHALIFRDRKHFPQGITPRRRAP